MEAFASENEKAHVSLIDGDSDHRAELADALSRYFAVTQFGDGSGVVERLLEAPPQVIIVDDYVPPAGGADVIRDIRRSDRFKSTKVLCTSGTPSSDFFAEARGMGIEETFSKPIKFRLLNAAIRGAVNTAVEKSWEDLEPVQKSALIKTVDVFNSISDLIDSGEPLPYGEVKESCEPLVNAVSNNRYKDLLHGVRGHDNYSYVHSMRVATFLSLFGNTIGIKGDDLLMLATGGLVHDIGKMTIPFEVLNKPGRLEGNEWDIMKSHVDRTLDTLANSPDIPKAVLTIASQHHEKLDGSGYPKGLKGGELNDLARMATIVDIFGALTDRRCYKDPMPPEKALNIMTDMGGALDQKFLLLFREMLLDAASE